LLGSTSGSAVAASLARGDDPTLSVPGVARPAAVASLYAENPRPVLVAIAGEDAAERFARQLTSYLPREDVLRFAERTDMPWSDEAPDPRVVGRRARAIHLLSAGRPGIVVASARALLRALPPQGSHVFEPLVLEPGSMADLEETAATLVRMGYERTEQAEERAQFAVRGGVLDVFPSDGTHPVRAEFFGDEIETLRRFVPGTGQTIGEAGRTEIFPCRELVVGSRAVTSAEKALRDRALREPEVAHHLEMMREGVYFNGIERYMPLFYRKPGSLTDYLAPRTLVVVAEPRSLFDDATRRREAIESAGAEAGVDLDGLFVEPARIDLGGRQRLTLLSLVRSGGAVDAEMAARRPDVQGGEQRFLAGLNGLLGAGMTVVLAVPDRRARARLTDLLAENGAAVERLEDAQRAGADAGEDASDGTSLRSGVVYVSSADIPSGYVVPSAGLAVVSVDDIYPRASATRRSVSEIDPTQVTFAFSEGDHVVHATHGIGLFKEMTRKEVLDSERDYLVLEYAKGDKLYVPVEQIDRVSKYVGPEGTSPRVTRLNTADWAKATGKARKAARKLAFDLVDLYARRAAVTGRVFSADSTWQMEMEAMFPFEETPDQLAAIADVKADMESDKPMDRLICGDVGYGKTEVALRAAFKAVQDGVQVMILCPTTILAQQHHTTFSERFDPFGVRVDVLSRFRSKTQQAESLAGFADGSVDVLIGTHRLLSSDVTPKELGLVIIDEEQRFGVGHKEHLKNLREQADILTLSATPIPRTLQMSLSGVRDMSVIDTAPPNRFPVEVHVGEYDPDVVSGAIRRETERGGQVYYVSNRVRSIDDAVERVRESAPEARVGVGHGQMSEHQLERIMEAFSANEYDVLVSTTIVESGIDNPHTNTLIIEDSQRLGLAQLYQLKGRVGRSHIKAYAYFMFPSGASLTEQAVDRLVAIKENAELGSGMKVAMRDLEIRGAGSLLGAEQSGNVSAVGFDLYAEMLRQAVAEVRGETLPPELDVRVDLPVPAFLPEDYVPAVDERVLLYRRVAATRTPEAVERLATEIVERYGPAPEPAQNMLAMARVRAVAAQAGVDSVTVVRRRLLAGPVTLDNEQRGALAKSGAIYLERERKIALPLEYGGSVTEAALGMLGAILDADSAQVESQEEA
jgi:transcription-repair coupling factor (superfamily II helicase)